MPLLFSVSSAGCAQLLDIDEFSDGETSSTTAPTGSASGGGQGGSSVTTGGGGATGGGGEPPSDCWAAPPEAWTETSFDRSTLAGTKPVEPMLDPTGLDLYYMAGDPGAKLPYVARRPDRDTPFSGGVQLPTQWEQSPAAGDPWLVGDELYFTVHDTLLGFGPAVALFDGTYWQDPAGLGAPFDTAASETGVTTSADGTRMMFSRADGPDGYWGATARLYEATRAAPVVPGDPFNAPELVAIPALTEEHYAMCPALSPDGTRLFFASSYPDPVTDDNYLHALKVWYAERETVDDPWQAPVHVDTLDSFAANACPSAVTADGCELWLNRFLLGQTYNEFAFARRTP